MTRGLRAETRSRERKRGLRESLATATCVRSCASATGAQPAGERPMDEEGRSPLRIGVWRSKGVPWCHIVRTIIGMYSVTSSGVMRSEPLRSALRLSLLSISGILLLHMMSDRLYHLLRRLALLLRTPQVTNRYHHLRSGVVGLSLL